MYKQKTGKRAFLHFDELGVLEKLVDSDTSPAKWRRTSEGAADEQDPERAKIKV